MVLSNACNSILACCSTVKIHLRYLLQDLSMVLPQFEALGYPLPQEFSLIKIYINEISCENYNTVSSVVLN